MAESGAQAKMLIDEGNVKRNGEVELRKRAKIVLGETIEVGEEVIEVISSNIQIISYRYDTLTL